MSQQDAEQAVTSNGAVAPKDGGRVRGGLRTDIQGMRALAVGVVLVYHVMPDWLTGGFVGVDVFFVISGFLITSHLVARPPARARDFAQFWARRARRLLPASLLVLAATLAATRLLGPETLWNDTARQGAHATVYVVNWLLASDAVDYLAAENAPTGVQHYWSLSVEEQFYAVWPLLIALLAWLAVRLRVRRELAWAVGLGVVAVASLAWSVHLTEADPGRAYFVTTTRVWELAVGGLVALLLLVRPARLDASSGRRGPAAEVGRALLAWAGLGAIVLASVTFDGETPFPSGWAAVPVLGAAAVVLACCGTQWFSPGWILALRPVQWLGDVSYAVYLWHWPIVVLVGARSAPIGLLDAAAIVAMTLVLAQLTKTYVEDPFRAKVWNVRLGLTYRLAAAGMVVVLAAAFLQQWEVGRRADAEADRVAAQLAAAGPCLGAGALDPEQDCGPAEGPVVPSPAQAANDKSEAYADVSGGKDCWSYAPRYRSVECTFGDGDVEVALVGNSHAGHWLPALQALGEARGWRITTHLASQCALATTEQAFDVAGGTEGCRDWVDRTVQALVDDAPDLVVVSNRISLPAVGKERTASADDYRGGYTEVFTRLAEAGVPLAVIRDTPAPVDGGSISSVPSCLTTEGEDTDACDGRRSDWVWPAEDPSIPAVREARRQVPGSSTALLDLNDRICDGESCSAVVGGVVAYFDGSHLTATFARTLAPALDDELARAGLLPRS